MSIISRIRRWLNTMKCDGCAQRVESVYQHHGVWRCNPCIVRRVRAIFILRQLERDGILTIVKES